MNKMFVSSTKKAGCCCCPVENRCTSLPALDSRTLIRKNYKRQSIEPCYPLRLPFNPHVWHRLYENHTGSSYRQTRDYLETDPPKNDLDFRLRTCYDHARETFAPKARIVVQPITVCEGQFKSDIYRQNATRLQSNHCRFPLDNPLVIVEEGRKEHFNEAAKGQHVPI